jgi:hypothetical protein
LIALFGKLDLKAPQNRLCSVANIQLLQKLLATQKIQIQTSTQFVHEYAEIDSSEQIDSIDGLTAVTGKFVNSAQ